MTEPAKLRLRERMDTGLEELLASIDALTDEDLIGPVDAVGWNVRDHLTHLAAWADGIAALLRRQDRWKAMGLDMEEPDQEPNYDQLNSQIVEQHRHITAAEARRWLIAAHQRVAEAMETLSEELLRVPYERFVAPYTGDGGHPIAEYILGNTEDHYDEHLPWILAIVPPKT